MNTPHQLAALAALFALAACGGGSGDAPNPAPLPAPTPSPSPTPAPTPSPSPAPGSAAPLTGTTRIALTSGSSWWADYTAAGSYRSVENSTWPQILQCATQYAYLVRQNVADLRPAPPVYVAGSGTPAPVCQRAANPAWTDYKNRLATLADTCGPHTLSGIDIVTYSDTEPRVSYSGTRTPPLWSTLQSLVQANHQDDIDECAQANQPSPAPAPSPSPTPAPSPSPAPAPAPQVSYRVLSFGYFVSGFQRYQATVLNTGNVAISCTVAFTYQYLDQGSWQTGSFTGNTGKLAVGASARVDVGLNDRSIANASHREPNCIRWPFN